MSEVKRIFTPGFTELPGCGDRCWSSAIDVDQWGARIEVYGMTSAEATELRDEVLRSITDFGAQRLRADTAEAELKRLDSLDTMQLIAELTKRNAAADQRIAELEGREVVAETEGVLTFMRSDSGACGCCGGHHIFCRYFEGVRSFEDFSQNTRFRNDLEGRRFRISIELMPDAALSTASPATISQQGEGE